MAPRLRAFARRWGVYVGRRWADVCMAVDLAPVKRRTGVTQIPRVLRVYSYSPTIDTVMVRMAPGQSIKTWEERAEQIADALGAVRVAVERTRPQVVGLVIERSEPFTEVLDAPVMPADSSMVDLGAVYLGEDEYGADWLESLIGQHWFVAGATGSGKASLIWSPLRSIAPLIRDGLVRVWMVDPKRMELSRGQGVAYRYAAEPDEVLELIQDFTEDCRVAQRRHAADRRAKFELSRETPFNLLVLDEMAALLSFGPNARETRKLLEEIGTQGRATGHGMLAEVQEPSKDVVPVRELFTVRICLRVTSAAHPDMVLGDGARLRGAAADEIPNDPSTAGIGFKIRASRVPARVRAAYVDDAEIDELVRFVTSGTGFRATFHDTPTNDNDEDEPTGSLRAVG
ncbi:hypothetical protein LWF15_02985 [Kineosporia rhizophila]|uniref:FtsK/SpoIIIE domain-containing protein n=1 Tax=Kineosporia TaxID=49184 RepID=UPI001E530AC2|nr:MULTISPECIES: FtsK/SpoIIIE domain-containing protein [Kineosporia]MCE0534463.1 hypothetical protein [Kineosporia rhizophila]